MTRLEAIQNWKLKIIKATDLHKLLRSIIKKKELLRYEYYGFHERARDLAKRLDEAERLERLEEAKSIETSN